MKYYRKILLLLILNILVIPSYSATVKEIEEILDLQDDDHYMGNKDAPVKLIEYSNLTCHVCAKFHNIVLKEVKKEYGKVINKERIVLADMTMSQFKTS